MHTPDHFNLYEAIERYIREINRFNLLNQEEREELIDHLLTEVENLQAEGFSEEEAFSISVEHLGPPELIIEEYRRVKPFYNLRKAVIAASLLTFFFIFIVGLLYALPVGVYLMARELGLDTTVANYLDIGLKIILILSAAGYFWWRFLKQRPIKAMEVMLIPILGLTAPFFKSILTYFFTKSYLSNEVLEAGLHNMLMIIPIILISLLAIHYRLIFKWKRSGNKFISEAPADIKAKIGIIVALFLSLTVLSFISFISSFSIWLNSISISGEGWTQLIDLVLKLLFLVSILATVVSRISERVFFKKFELLFIPLIGAVSPYLSDFLVVALASLEHFDLEAFWQVQYNSQIVLGFSFVLVTATTYSLLYKEHKQLPIVD